MPPKSQGESKQGLIITLVFFILATIGLGVAAYYGFSEQGALVSAKKEAEKKENLFKAERDWYQFQSQMYRSYMGFADNIPVADLGTKKAQFDQGSMNIGTYKDKDDVTKVAKDLNQRFGWKDNKPVQTYEGLVAEMRGQYEALEKRNLGLQQKLNETQKALKEATTSLEQAQNTYQTNLDKSKKENDTNQTNDREEIKKLRDEITRLGAQIEGNLKKADQEKQDLGKERDRLNREIAHYKELVEARNAEIAQFKLKSGEAPPNMRSDWKIVKMDTRGTRPYINLGSGDHVKPQLTFSIHGVGLDGRPVSQSKGTLEVVNVIGDHLSQARITSVKDPNRDPILQGDILYNPSWNPQIQKHVALAGVIDLAGDGRNNIQEFMRNLERQNIIVDAWLDPKDNTVKGKGITVRTDYLIIGQSGAYMETGARASDIERSKGMEKAIGQMKDQAAKNGVPIMDLYKYLEMIGYRLPRGVGENGSLYDTNRRPEEAPRLGGDTPPGSVPDK
jgi:hypothetical protein